MAGLQQGALLLALFVQEPEFPVQKLLSLKLRGQLLYQKISEGLVDNFKFMEKISLKGLGVVLKGLGVVRSGVVGQLGKRTRSTGAMHRLVSPRPTNTKAMDCEPLLIR